MRGDELRWVFTVGSRTYRTMLSKTIRLQLGSSNSQNMTADRAMRPALRSVVVGRASAP